VKRRAILEALVLLVAVACGGAETTRPPLELAVTPATTFLAGAGSTVTLRAAGGDGSAVTWQSNSPAVATVTSSGLVTAVATGTTSVTARAGEVSASADIEVWVAPAVSQYQAGVSYFGRAEYVEYIPGDLPVVLSHLKRTKLDPNREVGEAAAGNPYAENAWEEFQGYIEIAEAAVTDGFGAGLYVDVHGHGHAIARAELGYLLSAAELNLPDATLDVGYANGSSLRALAAGSPLPFSKLLRGGTSFGAFLGQEGIASVPSPAAVSPGTAEYFSGGYNTDRHGSAHGGTVSGFQMELHREGIRDTEENRRVFGVGMAAAVRAYMLEHLGVFAAPPP